jgi:FkbM family methyltransferase
MNFYYGLDNDYINITEQINKKFLSNVLFIPNNDYIRYLKFNLMIDKHPNKEKHILIKDYINNKEYKLDNDKCYLLTKKEVNKCTKYNWCNYISKYSDLKLLNTFEKAYSHYINHGKKEGRSIIDTRKVSYEIINNETNKLVFNEIFYKEQFYDLQKLDKDCYYLPEQEKIYFEHFNKHGINENRIGYINFDYEFYIKKNTDLKHLSYRDAINHYNKNGINENRDKFSPLKDLNIIPINRDLNSLKIIQNNLLKIDSNISFDQELIEQQLCLKYIKPTNKILEIGANVGRVSLILSTILNDSKNLVSLECCLDTFMKLVLNKNINNYEFNCERAVLSVQDLYISVLENSICSRPLTLDEYNKVIEKEIGNNKLLYKKLKKISYSELEQKYNINFDTLVIDCEGSFYNILKDFPNILDNINLIIIENDFEIIEQYNYVKDKFILKGFKNIETIKLDEDKKIDTKDFFYQVWKK